MNVWRLARKVAMHEPRSFFLGWLGFVIFFCMPALSGWVLARSYDAIENRSSGFGWGVGQWVAFYLSSELVRMVALHAGVIEWTKAWVHMESFLRVNMLTAQLSSGGPEAGQPVGSAGEAVTHFRDDTHDVAMLLDGIIDVSGGLAFTAVAGFVLGATNAPAAAILVLPLVVVAAGTRVLDGRIKAYRSADRAAAAAVSGLVGDIMAGATTIKVNDAADSLLGRLTGLVRHRSHTAVRDNVLDEGVQAFSKGAADVGLGLVLLVSASAIASGRFGVAQLALFTAYLGWLSFLPRMIGRLLARRKQAGVAFERMGLLVADQLPENTVQARHLPIEARQQRAALDPRRPERRPLARLDVSNLSARYDNGVGLEAVSFSIERGSFVVLTGPVGAGKSTLLRALLGLAWQADVEGEVRWNGDLVEDRAAFFVPPNAAFLSQVPQLVSDSVAENVSLGPVDPLALQAALAHAAIGGDIAALPEGVNTLIGPRGLRLSGGQRQRLATARALVHRPELVVLDDLSSALDVETELALWTNLASAGMTVLAVSHRAVAFERADQVLRLDGGVLTTEAHHRSYPDRRWRSVAPG